VLALALTAAIATSCGQEEGSSPDCDTKDPDLLATFAQSVPDADMVPCVMSLPPGWDLGEIRVDQDGAEMHFSSDRGGHDALTVTLREVCRPAGAKRIPSDEVGARRYERVRSVAPTYRGTRYYQFRGGCVTYDFELETARVSGLLNEASLMVGFTTRESLRELIRELTEGYIEDAP
jgi:hypothetical protein